MDSIASLKVQDQITSVSNPNQIAVSLLKQTMGANSLPEQLLQMLKSSSAEMQSIQNQMASGHFDVRV